MIRLESVNIGFDSEQNLLSNVNLSVRRGETFVLIGPSGNGKSTILKTVAGLIKPKSGNVKIDGEDLYAAPRSERAQLMQKMGMLFQKNALFDSFTVGENLAFPLKETTNLSASEINAKVKEFLGFVELSHAENLFPDEISGGMQKRVGIARALILNPEIILYDDPTAGLDPITSRIIIDLIVRLNKEFGTTVMAITNDMNRAFQMASNIGIVVDNRLVVTGSVEETKNTTDPRVKQFILGLLHGPLFDAATIEEAK